MEQSFSYLSHILSILVLSCDILGVFCIILRDFAIRCIRCRIWQLVGLDGVLGSSWPSESHGGILRQILQVSMVREVSDTCRCSGTSASCHKLSVVSGFRWFEHLFSIVGLRIAGVFGSIQALYGTLIISNHF